MITEDGWKWIDKENDTDMLFILLSFGCIKEMELTFCNTRRAVFENRDLCLILRDLMNNKEVMKETKKWIRDNKKDQ